MPLSELKSKYRKISSLEKAQSGWEEEYKVSSKQVYFFIKLLFPISKFARKSMWLKCWNLEDLRSQGQFVTLRVPVLLEHKINNSLFYLFVTAIVRIEYHSPFTVCVFINLFICKIHKRKRQGNKGNIHTQMHQELCSLYCPLNNWYAIALSNYCQHLGQLSCILNWPCTFVLLPCCIIYPV